MPRRDTPSIQDRIGGAIAGVCACDALGGPVQFMKRGTFRPVTGYRYNERFDMPPGAWSDDGSLTLCLAWSLIDTGFDLNKLTKNGVGVDLKNGVSVDKANLSGKFVAWLKDGFMSSADYAWDIGVGTMRTLQIWQNHLAKAEAAGKTIDVAVAQAAIDKAAKIEKMSGNGSLMRVAPIGILMYNNVEMAVKAARDQSDITHPYPACADACEVYTRLIVRIMRGEDDDHTTFGHIRGLTGKSDRALLARAVAEMQISDPVLRKTLQAYQTLEDWLARPEEKISSSGWVVHTLEAALWAFFTTTNFEAGALKAVNLGDDSDSVGAVYGGLAGAYYGEDAIPTEWMRGLAKKDILVSTLQRLR